MVATVLQHFLFMEVYVIVIALKICTLTQPATHKGLWVAFKQKYNKSSCAAAMSRSKLGSDFSKILREGYGIDEFFQTRKDIGNFDFQHNLSISQPYLSIEENQ